MAAGDTATLIDGRGDGLGDATVPGILAVAVGSSVAPDRMTNAKKNERLTTASGCQRPEPSQIYVNINSSKDAAQDTVADDLGISRADVGITE